MAEFMYRMIHPKLGNKAFTNKVELAEAYGRSGWLLFAYSTSEGYGMIYRPRDQGKSFKLTNINFDCNHLFKIDGKKNRI